jgi:hypothetical protein
MIDRARDLKKYSPFINYEIKDHPSEIDAKGRFNIFTP